MQAPKWLPDEEAYGISAPIIPLSVFGERTILDGTQRAANSIMLQNIAKLVAKKCAIALQEKGQRKISLETLDEDTCD